MDLSKYTSFFRSLKLSAASDGGDGTQGQAKVVPGSEELATYLGQFSRSVQQQVTAIEQQTNSNASGQPAAPPNVQALNVTASNGHFHAAITDQSSGLRRGINYGLQYDTSPQFTNPIGVHLGPNRNWDHFFGNATLYFRAFSHYDSSDISQHVYHGSASSPSPVTGGGTNPGPQFQASRGSGTAAEGVGTGGPGPIPERTETSGYNWKEQRAQVSQSTGFQGQGTPAGSGATPSGSGGGGGGGGLVTNEQVIADSEALASVAGTNTITAKTATPYSALSGNFLVRLIPAVTNTGATTLNVNGTGAKAVTKNGTTALSGGELVSGQEYVLLYDGTQFQIVGLMASMISGDFTVAATGVGTLATVNSSPGGPFTNATVTVNAKGLVTAASSGAAAGNVSSAAPLALNGIVIGAGGTVVEIGNCKCRRYSGADLDSNNRQCAPSVPPGYNKLELFGQ